MDSYHRGWTADGTQQIREIPGDNIGDVIIDSSYTGPRASSGLPSWESVGFSASVYRNVNGKTVIAYRGTDSNGRNGDALHGWLLGTGYYPAAQGQLAIELYEQVSGHPISQGGDVSIELTGHSLGGGLAGYVSALSGSRAIGYDHMPFRLAATLKMSVDAIDQIITIIGDAFQGNINILDPANRNALIAAIGDIKVPDLSVFEGIALDEEVLQYLREGYSVVISSIGEKLDEVVLEAINRSLRFYLRTDRSCIRSEWRHRALDQRSCRCSQRDHYLHGRRIDQSNNT
jgi:hypothetical protein